MSLRLRFQLRVQGLLGDRAVRLILALSIAHLVAGCRHEWGPHPVEAGQSAIRFDHADFDPDLAEYQFDRHPRTGSDLHVAQFFGADAYAGVVVSKAAAGYGRRAADRGPGRTHV